MKKRQPTKESMAIAAAIQSCGKSKAAIAEELGVQASNVSHWALAIRPVPAEKAVALANSIGLAPEVVSRAYARVAASSGGASVVEDSDEGLRPDLEIARLQNDIHALNLALGTLVVTMTRHRPTEAKDAAAAMRKMIPKKFRDRGLVHELLRTLEQA